MFLNSQLLKSTAIVPGEGGQSLNFLSLSPYAQKVGCRCCDPHSGWKNRSVVILQVRCMKRVCSYSRVNWVEGLKESRTSLVGGFGGWGGVKNKSGHLPQRLGIKLGLLIKGGSDGGLSLFCLPTLPSCSQHLSNTCAVQHTTLYCGKEDKASTRSSSWIPSSREDGYPITMCSKFRELGNLGSHPFFATTQQFPNEWLGTGKHFSGTWIE